ncbi:hypothetical protein D0864_08359 [Hortaea werneckii]|uniref:Uncharacterized protein n=1 Tax=Hortaea werneckii TaxID=91943 RepID=A0A3M7EXP8_HORWE|nr:hypothetical protein D0864_08359 [Hortaea werneckii]
MHALAARPRWLIVIVAFAISTTCLYFFWQSPQITLHQPPHSVESERPGSLRSYDSLSRLGPKAACKGPGGYEADYPHSVFDLPNVTYPTPTIGSFEAVGLEESWLTIDQRYGPYGYGEEDKAYAYPRVDWNAVDWGQLQSDCFKANEEAYGYPASNLSEPRFRNVKDAEVPAPPRSKTGRQAIILRTWSTYEYHPEDMWNIRSLISEAALATGAEYRVFLLVDMKCENCSDIYTNTTSYEEALTASVPAEFRNIAVLFHPDLQHSWYEKIDDYRPMFQIMQPLQLFAHFYPEYDHFWQFEMDARFLGHVGKMLRAFDAFSRKQPLKQAPERASWAYMPKVHGSYDHFKAMVDKGLKGDATIWGPEKVQLIDPIGPEPPVKDPKQDPFEWGVGQDADLLLFGTLNDVRRFESGNDWVFNGYLKGGLRGEYPRYMSVPAQARASWDLLESVHVAQHKKGLAIASEATLPSFAMWNGLKVIGLPTPKFQFPERDIWELNHVQNGGFPSLMKDGFAYGPGKYRGSSFAFFSRPLSFDWWSSLCDPIFERWMKLPYGKSREDRLVHDHPEYVEVPNEMPFFMQEVDGEVYVPNIMLHPRKSNSYRAPEK